jgi:hypothetical protein
VTAKALSTAPKTTSSTSKITAAKGKAATMTTKIATTASETAALATGSRDIGTIGTPGLPRPVADAGAVLSDAISPAVQPVLTPTSRLSGRVLAVLEDKAVQGIPPVLGAGGLIPDPLLPTGNQPGSGLGIRPSIMGGMGQAPPGSAGALAHPASSQPNGMTTTSSSSSGLTAVLSDLASGLSQALLGVRASSSGAVAAVALLSIGAGVAAAGSASTGGPAGISFGFVEGSLLSFATGRARRLDGILRQAGWRTPHRPSFSPD